MESILSQFRTIPTALIPKHFIRPCHRRPGVKVVDQRRTPKLDLLKTSKKPGQAMFQTDPRGARIDTYDVADSVANMRNWKPVSVAEKEEYLPPGLSFKLVSYNVLAQDLLVDHLHLYRNCKEEHLRWNDRSTKLIEEIRNQQPDLICLQEVQQSHLVEFEGSIKRGLPMNCLFKKKTGLKSDGCAIFYNRVLFKLVDYQSVEYYQPGCSFLDRHNIALIAILRCRANPEVSFIACTTHLLFNPRREDIRLAQTAVLLAELDRLSVVSCDSSGNIIRLPILLTGDFNFTPSSAPYKLLTSGLLHYEDLTRNTLKPKEGDNPLVGKYFLPPVLGITDSCQHIDCIKSNYKDRSCSRLFNSEISKTNGNRTPPGVMGPDLFSSGTLTHNLKLRSLYSLFGDSFGSTFQNGWKTVDHIFYSGSNRSPSLRPLSVFQLPTVQDCFKLKSLPNAELGSDHLMLASQLRLCYPPETEAM